MRSRIQLGTGAKYALNDDQRNTTNVLSVVGYSPPPSSEIDPQTYNPTTARHPGAYLKKERKPKEIDPAHPAGRVVDRFQH